MHAHTYTHTRTRTHAAITCLALHHSLELAITGGEDGSVRVTSIGQSSQNRHHPQLSGVCVCVCLSRCVQGRGWHRCKRRQLLWFTCMKLRRGHPPLTHPNVSNVLTFLSHRASRVCRSSRLLFSSALSCQCGCGLLPACVGLQHECRKGELSSPGCECAAVHIRCFRHSSMHFTSVRCIPQVCRQHSLSITFSLSLSHKHKHTRNTHRWSHA